MLKLTKTLIYYSCIFILFIFSTNSLVVAADYTLLIESQQSFNEVISSFKDAQQVITIDPPPGVGKIIVNADPTITANTDTTTSSSITTLTTNTTSLTTTIIQATDSKSNDYTVVIVVTCVIVGVIGLISVIALCV